MAKTRRAGFFSGFRNFEVNDTFKLYFRCRYYSYINFRCHMHRECKQRNENRHMFFAKEKQSSDIDDMKAKIKSTDVRHAHRLTFLDN